MQVWAVDVSGFALWDQAPDKGEHLIHDLLCNAEEENKVKRYVREIDQIRESEYDAVTWITQYFDKDLWLERY